MLLASPPRKEHLERWGKSFPDQAIYINSYSHQMVTVPIYVSYSVNEHSSLKLILNQAFLPQDE